MSDSENEDGVFENIAEQMKNKFVTKKKIKKQDVIEPRRSKRKAYSKTSDTTLATKAGTSESVAATAVETPMDLSKTIYKSPVPLIILFHYLISELDIGL